MNELNESHHESKRLSYFESENLAEHSEDEIQIDKDTLIPAHKKKTAVAPHKKIHVDTLK